MHYFGGFKSRQEAINSTIEFLAEYELVKDKESALAAVKEYDESQSEFTVPIAFRFGWHGTAPVAGAVAPLAPVYLYADLFFQFYDSGKLRVIIKNIQECAYMEYGNISKSLLKTMKLEEILTEQEYGEFVGYTSGTAMQAGLGKALTAFLVWANSGADKISDFRNELSAFFDNIDKQIEIAKKLADKGYYVFGTPEENLKYYKELIDKKDLNIPAATITNLEKEIAEGKLTTVYNYFWQRDIKKELDYVFIAICGSFNGKIEGIAEDGEVSWELVGDKLLPKDSKLRKKLEKSGMDYFSYYGE